jgi:hypothetical protein
MMATIDNGFRVGDKVVPESFNTFAEPLGEGESCEVIYEDGRYTMKVRYPSGKEDFAHPYRWKKAEPACTYIVRCARLFPAEVTVKATGYRAAIVAAYGAPYRQVTQGLARDGGWDFNSPLSTDFGPIIFHVTKLGE